MYVKYGGYFIYCIICAAAVFLTCSQQNGVDVLAVASLRTCSAATAALQIYSAKTKHIKIVMYIIMPIPPRFVMTEVCLFVCFFPTKCELCVYVIL